MKTILFVEDEPTLQKRVGEALEREGFKIFKTLDGEDGLRVAKKEIPDLILLDIILPKKNGFEVLAELKQDPKTAAIPVIILTNLENNSDIEKALALGASTYLVKANYELKEIVKKIRELLDKK